MTALPSTLIGVAVQVSLTIVPRDGIKIGSNIKQYETVFKLQPLEKAFQVSIPLEKQNGSTFAIGDRTTISLTKNHKRSGSLEATTVAIERKSNGKHEAIMEIHGDTNDITKIIFASGFKDIGVQRIPATITSGQTKVWQSIKDIIFKEV